MPYVIHPPTSTSAISLYSDTDEESSDELCLETHHYVSDRSPAPFSESFQEGGINSQTSAIIQNEVESFIEPFTSHIEKVTENLEKVCLKIDFYLNKTLPSMDPTPPALR